MTLFDCQSSFSVPDRAKYHYEGTAFGQSRKETRACPVKTYFGLDASAMLGDTAAFGIRHG